MSSGSDTALQPRGRRRSGARRRGLRTGLIASATVILLAGGYTAACALTPLPDPQLQLATSAEADPANLAAAAVADELAERAQSAIDNQRGPAAIGWAGSEEVWSNDDTPRPIASISKLVTVLVGLEREPLAAGEPGPVHVWTAADAARTRGYQALDGIAFPIPVGTEVTTRQMLTLALLPSANDFMAAYAADTIGEGAEFSRAVSDWAERHGVTSLSLAEPTGMDEDNVAAAADVVRIAKLALAEPVIAEIVRMPSAELPWGIGEVTNTNPLLTKLPGVIGLKTGTSGAAGSNLVAAQEAEAGEREVVRVAAVLGRDSGPQRAHDTSTLLTGMGDATRQVQLVHPEEELGTATLIDGTTVPLIADGSAATVLVAGEHAEREVRLDAVGWGPARQVAGSIIVTAPEGEHEVPVVTAEPLTDPDLWWRVTHPALVFGWAEPAT
ncbi:D-alanyl-D-alanine carboxypeptidase family protein [Leucobacter chromiireducens]|uniref:D-alanyl-D-alanine carboxypeptidase family protein n=1 Tax=Leucobacter chromiireducens TaxID=283877 RepID=UPI000F63B0BD|nr:D-alanyl-D-alanine carboxypeptidase [Leucobacter chromiireducens]